MARTLTRLLVLMLCCAATAQAAQSGKKAPAPAPAPAIKLLQKALDPFGYPRPAAGDTGVPVRTSIYFELGLDKPKPGDRISTATVAVTIQAAGQDPREVLRAGGRFTHGFTGWIRPTSKMMGAPAMAVYFQPARPLDPLTTYTVRVAATSEKGATFPRTRVPQDRWSFRTAAPAKPQTVRFEIDLGGKPVRWQGSFFSGFCKPQFCNSAGGLEPSYEMMARDRKGAPKAWNLQRDFWLTGMDHSVEGGSWLHVLPNVVRELETRRVAAITTASEGYLLKVEDFFGHEQYGIESNRPLSADYQKGYEVLVADGTNHGRARVLKVDDQARTVLVSRFDPAPAAPFKIDNPLAYAMRKDDPNAPGLFPMGGCYLRRFEPAGTPKYYWGRVDKEWDIARSHGTTLMPNFTDAPGDVSVNGQNWSPPKDYVELHETTRAITSHIIERWGAEAALTYTWSVFNEPDLGPLFWHGTREELNKFYDYSSDAILRAFEEHGLDSGKVFIGGLELGAIFPNLGGLDEFLRHCTPNGTTTASLNAAFADPRLEGKRSKRVETLCRAHGGKGAPLDFVSIHAYNRSAVMAGKLALAKDKSLAVDPQYYEKLWICSHEACPDWMTMPDEAFSDCFLGDGYYPAWCADVIWRQLTRAAADPRYAMGQTILTFWPWPNGGSFGNTNAATQVAKVDDDGDGKADREATLPMPVYHLLTLLGTMGDEYRVLPERKAGGHTVAGFGSRGADGRLRVLLYAHDPADVQARAGQTFKVELTLKGTAGKTARAASYRFDAKHNSYFETAREIFKRPAPQVLSRREFQRLEKEVSLKSEAGRVRAAGEGNCQVTAELAGNGATLVVLDGVQ